MSKKTISLFLAVCMALSLVFAASCGPAPSNETTKAAGGEKTVSSIEISKNPTKTEYFVGDEFSAAGGEIKVTYSDNSTEVKSMTDSEVTLSDVNTQITTGDDSQDKTVTVRYGGKSARFTVKVSYEMMNVTFNYNNGAENKSLTVRKGSRVDRPEDPEREGFNFENWYADEALTKIYDFAAAVDANTGIYAKWLEAGEDVVYYAVQFSANYDGAIDGDPQTVKEGDKAVKPSDDPERFGYEFTGWFADKDATTAYDFDAPIAGDTTIYAGWKSTVTGRNWYTFEAEDPNLRGKTGPGLSGTASAEAMIQNDTTLGASNNRWVGYLYEMGLGLEFQFTSDRAIDDAKIVISLSAELRDFDIDSETFRMELNAKPIEYPAISFKDVPTNPDNDVDHIYALQFKEYLVIEGASLKEGKNAFIVTTMNDEALSGTTMAAKAPLVDCVKIETEAILDWDRSLGLPKENY